MRKALGLVAVAVVWVGACGGNVVVDGSSKTTSSGSTSTASANGGATATVTNVDSSSTAFGTTAFSASTGFGGGVNPGEGVGPTTVETVGTTVTGGGGSVVVGCAPCDETLAGPPGAVLPVCNGAALAAYDDLLACGCSQNACLTECGANYCSKDVATTSCANCLVTVCASQYMTCNAN